MSMLRFIICIIFFILASVHYCQSLENDKFTADFLREFIPVDGMGMGGSFAAHNTGSGSLNNNPAGLAFLKNSDLSIRFYRSPRISAIIMKETEDDKWSDYGMYNVDPYEIEYISYALSLGKVGNLGIGAAYNHSGRFIRVNNEGKAINAFPKDDLLVGLGYSIKIYRNFAGGFDIKYLRSKLPFENKNEIGKTYLLNIGLINHIGTRAKIGLAIKNIGKPLSYNSPDIPAKLRREIVIGTNYILKDTNNSKFSINVDINPPFEDGVRYNTGAEFLFKNKLAFRIGYVRNTAVYYEPLINLITGTTIDEKRLWIRKGMTYGLGLKTNSFELNIARAPYRKPEINDDEKLRIENDEQIISFSFIKKF